MANDTSIAEALVPIVQDATNRFLDSRREALSKMKATATKGLVNSLAEDVSADVSRGMIEVLIKFERSGRYLDMKKGTHDGVSPELIKELTEWVKSLGAENFRKRHKSSRPPRDAAKLANSVAWAIAKRKQVKNKRRKRWWNRPKGYFINRLANEILAASGKEALKAVKDEFQRGQRLLNQA